MKLTFISLFLLVIVIKGFSHSVPLNKLQSHEKFKREIKEEVAVLTNPVLEAAQYLQHQIAFYQRKHDQAITSPKIAEFNIDTDACQNLSNTLVTAGQLAWNASLTVYHMTLNVTDTLADLTDCIQWNPIDTAKCYVNSITNVIQTVKSIKPTIVKTLKEIVNMSSRLEAEFLECIGNGLTTAAPTTKETTTTTEATTALTSTTTTTTARSWWPW